MNRKQRIEMIKNNLERSKEKVNNGEMTKADYLIIRKDAVNRINELEKMTDEEFEN